MTATILLMCLFSLVLLGVCNVIAMPGTRRSIVVASLAAGAGIVAGMLCMPLPMSLNGLLVVLAGLFCLCTGPTRQRYLVSSLLATGVSYVLAFAMGYSSVREWTGLKDRYPFESMSDRLAYETRARRGHSQASPAADSSAGHTGEHPSFGPTKLEGLEKVIQNQGRLASFRRSQSLQEVHAGVVQQFIDSPGFGPARRIAFPSPRYLEFDETGPIPLPEQEYEDPSKPQDWTAPQAVPNKNLPPEDALLTMHADDVMDFVHSIGFGWIRDRDHVAGFRPHQFQADPQKRAPERWRVLDIELVSLLKYETPVAYLSDHFPRMDELRHANTRPLDAFETKALEDLRRGQDLKVGVGADHIRMLGSIRALEQCVRCHQVEYGELLGAFSYRLRRQGGGS